MRNLSAKMMNGEQLKVLSHLQGLGVPLDGEAMETLKENAYGLEVCQTGWGPDNCIEELDNRATAFVVSIGIENRPGGAVTIDRYYLGIPWANVEWVKEPARRLYGYQLPPPLLHPYARELVLNHRVGRHGRIPPRGLLEGLLLALSTESIPMEFSTRQLMRAPLWIFDTKGNRYGCDVTLRVMRCQRKRILKPSVEN